MQQQQQQVPLLSRIESNLRSVLPRQSFYDYYEHNMQYSPARVTVSAQIVLCQILPKKVKLQLQQTLHALSHHRHNRGASCGRHCKRAAPQNAVSPYSLLFDAYLLLLSWASLLPNGDLGGGMTPEGIPPKDGNPVPSSALPSGSDIGDPLLCSPP